MSTWDPNDGHLNRGHIWIENSNSSLSATQILLVTVNPHYARFYLVLLIVGYFRTAAIFLGGETARTPTSFHRPLDFPDFSLSSKCFEMNHFPLSNFWVTFIIIDIDIADFKLHHPREKSELQYNIILWLILRQTFHLTLKRLIHRWQVECHTNSLIIVIIHFPFCVTSLWLLWGHSRSNCTFHNQCKHWNRKKKEKKKEKRKEEKKKDRKK